MISFIKKQARPRKSNFELLRIIAILLILAHHFCVHGGFEYDGTQVSLNKYWIDIFSMGGKIGVNIFVLISGYFLINSKYQSFNKSVKLWAQLFFYSLPVFIILHFTKNTPPMNTNGLVFEIIKSCFPVITEVWWFATTYFLLYIFSPFINRFLFSLDRKSYQLMLLMMTFLWSIIPIITLSQWTVKCTSLVWFVYLYSLAGYYRLYWEEKMNNKRGRFWFGLAFLLTLFICLTVLFIMFLGCKFSFFTDKTKYFMHEHSIFLLLISICLFLGFHKLSFESKTVNFIASSVFGVYLIHDNPYLRTFIWNKLFRVADYQDSCWLIPYSVAVVLIVFFCCCIIELLRKYIFEPSYLRVLMVFLNPLKQKVKKLIVRSIR